MTQGEVRGDTYELVESLSHKLAQVEAVGDTRGDGRALVDNG